MKKHSKGNKVPKVLSSPKSGHKSKRAKNKADKEGIIVVGQTKAVQFTIQVQYGGHFSGTGSQHSHIVVLAKPIPLLVTPRSPRSARSQRSLNRVCTHMHQSV